MPVSSFYNISHCIIETKAHGFISVMEISISMQENLQLALHHNCPLWLIDYTEATVDISLLQILNAAENISIISENLGNMKFHLKRAFVTLNHNEDIRFFENVSVNRGQNLKLFKEVESARKWLLD
jgi:hypothetical protein